MKVLQDWLDLDDVGKRSNIEIDDGKRNCGICATFKKETFKSSV